MWKNTREQYGRISRLLHWLMAIMVVLMAASGLYMVELDYYDPWYHQLPQWHKLGGLIVLVLLILRIVWRWINVRVEALAGTTAFEMKAAQWVHHLFYVLLCLIPLSGYLISTADGKGITWNGLVLLPALFPGFSGQADMAGKAHLLLVWCMAGLLLLHVAAALKHHVINKDKTLKRMLGGR